MIIDHTSIVELTKDSYFRCDVDNLKMRHKYNFSGCSRLADYITFIETGKPIKPSDYVEESDNIHLVVRNIVDGNVSYDNVIYITDEKADALKSYRIEKDDIIIAISANCGAAFYYEGDKNENITLSHYLCRIKIDKTKLLPKYLTYYLNSPSSVDYFRGVETGKTQKNLAKYYIRNFPIRVPTVEKQKELCETIAPYKKQILKLSEDVGSSQKIIDSVFQCEFNFDYANFEELKTHKTYTSKESLFSNNPDLRFSAKFHRPAGYYVMEQLTGISDKKIKHFLAEPIVLGASVSPKDYDENGEYSYISMATIKSWAFDSSSASTVSDDYASSNLIKNVQIDDIILARSGEGTIGKVAIIQNEDIKGIFADFTMRIRLRDYNPTFAYYYFRTSYFQYLIEVYKKGLGNNTNIFPIIIQEFPIPNIKLVEQQRIVDEIQAEISKQDDIKNKIAKLRSQIDEIIMETINV